LATELGIKPWLDEADLLPGQTWQLEIPKAVRASDVVIVCLSSSSSSKAGYVQKEIKYALDVADEQPEGTIFVIPLRLEDCVVPDRLSHLQWVNYYEQGGHERLIRALRSRSGNSNEQELALAPPADGPKNLRKMEQPPLLRFSLATTRSILQSHVVAGNGLAARLSYFDGKGWTRMTRRGDSGPGFYELDRDENGNIIHGPWDIDIINTLNALAHWRTEVSRSLNEAFPRLTRKYVVELREFNTLPGPSPYGNERCDDFAAR